MARRIRAHDWAESALGPTTSWPQELRTCVDVVLAARTPMVLHWGADFLMIYNDAWIAFAREAHPAALGRPTREVFPEAWPRLELTYTALMDGAEAIVACDQYVPIQLNGRLEDAWWTYNLSPVHADDGRILGLFSNGLETTAQHRTQAALRESEARLAFLLKLSDACRATNDPLTLVREACALLGEHLGVDRVKYAEIDGGCALPWHGYERGVDPLPRERTPVARFGERILEAYQRGESVAIDDVEASPLLTPAERQTRVAAQSRAFVGIPLMREGRWVAAFGLQSARARRWTESDRQLTHEVAHRVWTAVERARSATALRESEERLRLALDVAGLGTWDRNLIDGTAKIDIRTAEMLDVATGPVTDVLAVQQSVVHRDDLLRVEEVMAAGIRSGRSFDVGLRVVHRDGKVRHIATRARAFPDETGRPARLLGTTRDVTAEHEAEARLRASEARLLEAARHANQVKDEFLAMLGHELRNPLTPILATLELMRLEGSEAFAAERDVIERQARHLARLVDDLLDVTRIVRGKIALRRQRLDLGSVIHRAVESVSPLLEEKGHRLVTTIDGNLPVEGDTDRLLQILSNLLGNAAHYTDRGGRIQIEGHLDGGHVVVSVSDNGIGIEPELLPVVFELFRQGARTIDRAQGGLGLGLTIVHNLVELHGGTVVADSAGRGKGSTFTVRLPRATIREKARIVRPTEESRGPTAGEARRVLVVDDNHDIADVIATLLRSKGCAVEVAYAGAAGLEAARRFRPTIALLDIGLPEMDGYELARRIKADNELRDIRLVAVTGYGQRADRRRALRAGFSDHLVKPFDFAQLAAIVSPPARPADNKRLSTKRVRPQPPSAPLPRRAQAKP
jgi:signal transduction histidine kinase/ActR/RegA family two-component response regulator